MLKLEQIQKNADIAGIDPGQVVRVVTTTEPVGDNALKIYYKTAEESEVRIPSPRPKTYNNQIYTNLYGRKKI